MPVKSNTELLGDILGTLDEILKVQESHKKQYASQVKVEVKNNKDIIALLTAMGAMSNQPGLSNTGTLIESLARGISALSKIKDRKIESTAKKIEFLAKKINELTKHIPQNADKTLEPLTTFVSKFETIINTKLIDTLNKFGPLNAIKAGLGISLFFKILAKTVAKMGPKALADIIKATAVKPEQAKSLNTIIETVMGIDPKKLKELSKAAAKLDPSGGDNIAKFFEAIIKIMPKTEKQAKAISTSLAGMFDALSKLTLKTVLIIALFGKLANEKLGNNIYGFLNKLLKITKDYKEKDIKNLNTLFTGLSKALLNVALAIGLLVAIVTFAKIENVLLALGIITLVTVGLVGIAKWIGNKKTKSEMESGINGLETLSKCVLMITGAIGLMTLIVSLFKLEDVLLGLGIVTITIVGLVAATKYLAGKDKKDLINNGVKNLQALCISLLVVTVAIGIMTFIVSKNKVSDILLGAFIVMGTIAFLVGMTKWLSSIKKNQLETANMTLIVLTGMLLAVSIIAAFILPKIGENIEDAAIGALVVVAIIGLMVLTVKWMTTWKKKDLELALIALGTLTVMLLAVSLIAAFILPKIGENIKEAGLGAIVVLGIIGIMVLMVKWITTWKKKDLTYAMWAMGSMTLMLLVVSLIALYILPEIGKQWDDALIGGGIVLGIIGLMGVMVYLLGKIKMKAIKNSALVLAEIAAMLFVTSEIILNFIIPIGERGEEALYGSGIVLATVGIMGAIIAALGQMDLKTIGKGAGAVAAIGAVLWALGELMPNYVKLTKLVWDNAEAVALGGAEIIATLGVWGGIFYAIGRFMNKEMAKYLAAGAGVVAGISAVLWALGELLPTYMETAMMMEANAKEIAIGGVEIVATLTAWGLIFAGVGALLWGPLALVVAAGAGAITAIAAVLNAIGEMLPSYIKTAIMMGKNKKDILTGSDVIKDTIKKFGLILGAVGLMAINPFVTVALAAGTGVVLEFAAVMKALGKGLDPLIDVIKKMKDNNITSKTISDFLKVFVGNGKGGDGTLMGAISNIVDGLNEVGLKSSVMAAVISKNLRPIFETLALFIDVVAKTCSLKYVSEWDKDGKPAKWETITPAKFKSAGTAISTAFGVFLTSLGMGLKLLDKPALEALEGLSKGIKPVMESVGTFTNAILTVISAAIPEEWDKDGKPIKFRKFDRSEFALAAVTISDAFSTFITTMIPKLGPIGELAGMLIDAMKGGIEPLMNAVNTYTDAITGLIYGKEVTFTDLNGKEIKKFMEYDPEQFKAGAENIANCFFDFIDTMYSRFSAQGYTEHKLVESNTFSANKYEDVYHNNVADLINGMSGIQTIILSVSEFIDVIEKTALKGEKIDLKTLGEKMANLFTDFIDTMNKKIGGESVEKQLQQTIKNIKVSKNLVSVFNTVMDILIKGFKNDITKLSEDFVNSSVVPAVNTLLRVVMFIDKLNVDGKSINIRDARTHAKYISQMLVYFAKALKEYQDVANILPNYSFISGMAEELEKAYQKATSSYNTFTANFLRIDKQLRSAISPYNTMMKGCCSVTIKLGDAFKRLDKILKDNEKERTKILVKFKDDINAIGKELDRVNKAMEKSILNQKAMDKLKTEISSAPLQSISSALTPKPAAAPSPKRANETDEQYKKRIAAERQNQNNNTDISAIALLIGAAVTRALDHWATKEWKVIITADSASSPWLTGKAKAQVR